MVMVAKSADTMRKTTSAMRADRRSRRLAADGTLGRLVSQLIAARVKGGHTQLDVAVKLGTTKSAISRLESGFGHRPTLTTIENYALAVGCVVEIRLRPWP